MNFSKIVKNGEWTIIRTSLALPDFNTGHIRHFPTIRKLGQLRYQIRENNIQAQSLTKTLGKRSGPDYVLF